MSCLSICTNVYGTSQGVETLTFKGVTINGTLYSTNILLTKASGGVNNKAPQSVANFIASALSSESITYSELKFGTYEWYDSGGWRIGMHLNVEDVSGNPTAEFHYEVKSVGSPVNSPLTATMSPYCKNTCQTASGVSSQNYAYA